MRRGRTPRRRSVATSLRYGVFGAVLLFVTLAHFASVALLVGGAPNGVLNRSDRYVLAET